MYYNQIEISNPFISYFFPELSENKIFKLSIVTELEEYDIGLLNQANQIIDILDECLEDEDVDLDIDQWFNPRYFPNIEHSEEDEDETTRLLGDTLYTRDSPEYSMEDYMVSETIASIANNDLCEITTLILSEPPKMDTKIRMH